MARYKLPAVPFLVVAMLSIIFSNPVTMVSAFDLEDPSGVRLGFSGDPSSTMVVSWWTASNNTDSTVYYGLSPSNLDNVVTGTKKIVDTGYIHDVEIIGLEGGTMHFYKAGGESGNSSVYNFTTAPGSKTSNVHFVACGDTRTNYERRRLTRNMILQASDRFGTEPGFVLNAGDVVDQGEIQEQYDNYSVDMEPLASHVPIMHVAGNHDDDADTKYPDQFTEPTNGNDGWYYSFDWGSVHFVAMNTETDIADGYLDASFLTWLENDLKSARENDDILWIVGWFHRPLYVSFSHAPEYNLWWDWNGLFTDYDVDLLFAGHSHAYQRNYPINDNGIISSTGDPNYVNPSFPIHVVSGAGAVHSEGYTQDDMRNDTYHAKWNNGDYVFFPSNHFCDVKITLDENSMTTRLQMNVVGLNWTLPNITENNYSAHLVDQMSITKDIPEGFFGNDGIDVVLITVLVASISSSAVVMVMVIAWKIHRGKMVKKKERETGEEKRYTNGQ